MAPGGSAFLNVTDAGSAPSDYGIAPENDEYRSPPNKNVAAVVNEKLGMQLDSAVHDLLECPVCMNLMYPPIQQCPNGHTLCSNCKSKVRCCPVCRHELGNIRCLALEKIAESLELPCKYQNFGCQHISSYHIRLRHEQLCPFRLYNCPYAGTECIVTGDIQFLVAHLKDDHKVDVHNGCTFNHRYVKSNPREVDRAIWMLTVSTLSLSLSLKLCEQWLDGGLKWLYLRKLSDVYVFLALHSVKPTWDFFLYVQVFNCFGHQFCLHFEAFHIGKAPVYMAFLRFMGSNEDAEKFSYSLEVGGNGRKLKWQGVPRSIRDSHKTVRDSMDGLIIQRSMALSFFGGERQELKLKVAGRIWRNNI